VADGHDSLSPFLIYVPRRRTALYESYIAQLEISLPRVLLFLRISSTMFPLDLWIVIADLLTEELINPAYNCNHWNFPQIDHYIRCPQALSSVITVYRRLRLVCRTFNENFKSPPRFFMKVQSAQSHMAPGHYTSGGLQGLRAASIGYLKIPRHAIEFLPSKCRATHLAKSRELLPLIISAGSLISSQVSTICRSLFADNQ